MKETSQNEGLDGFRFQAIKLILKFGGFTDNVQWADTDEKLPEQLSFRATFFVFEKDFCKGLDVDD